jgi:hypothetical protein
MISVHKDRITFSQIVILAWAGALALTVLFFYLVVNRAIDMRALEIRVQMDLEENHVKWLRQTIDRYQDPIKVMDHFASMDRDLDRKFPATAEKSFLMLTDYANKFGVRVEKVRPDRKLKVVNFRGAPLAAEGKTCYGVPVSLTFKSEYLNLVKYLDALRKVLPAYVVVRNLSIENKFSPAPKLEGTIDLSLYLLE